MRTMQMAHVMNDSKSFVDRPLKASVQTVLDEFKKLPKKPSSADCIKFMDKWMHPPGYEVQKVTPADWVENPAFVSALPVELRPIGKSLHSKWHELVRTFNFTGLCDGCYSSIAVPNPFVVAGGRFREYYYWDSYWILQGLLVSDMTTTARHMVDNMVHLVNTLGFIPNGGRIYYLNRSQPPFLTLMAHMLYQRTQDTEWIKSILPTLENEYQFWMEERTTRIDSGEGKTWTVQRYLADTVYPRPESYREDYSTCIDSNSLASNCYRNLASGAESGWDFSSRWLSDWDSLNTIRTASVIPVDLNSIMYRIELALADIYTSIGNNTRAHHWVNAAANRATTIHKVFWSDFAQTWGDYIADRNNGDIPFYIANLMPMWAGAHHQSPQEVLNIVKRLWPKIFYENAGIPTSLIQSRQQWDFPNAWAPLQQFIIDGLDSLNLPEATSLADKLAISWFNTNYCAWQATEKASGLFFEKYDVLKPGSAGGGGEYSVQAGFGWTNGVMLKLLQTRSHVLSVPDCSKIGTLQDYTN